MTFVFSAEQEALRASVRRFLADRSPESEVRRLMESTDGYDPSVWQTMATQLGLQSLMIPDEYGGAGCGFLEVAVVLEEMGRALLPAPYFATAVLAVNVLLLSGDKAAQAAYLPGIAEGDTIATFALTEPNARWDLGGIHVEGSKDGDGYTVSGVKSYVLDGHAADLILVAARVDGELALFAVAGTAAGLRRTALTTMDTTRRLARLDFDATRARRIGLDCNAEDVVRKTLGLAAIALSVEAVGGAQSCIAMAVEYAKVRVQFGRAIGSFQAIKHRCADMLLEVEGARAAAYHAAWAVAEGSDEIPVAASLAKAYCSEAYFRCAADNIQIHGGIGFTWEHPAHLYYKRAKSSEQLFGGPSYHRELLLQRLGI